MIVKFEETTTDDGENETSETNETNESSEATNLQVVDTFEEDVPVSEEQVEVMKKEI